MQWILCSSTVQPATAPLFGRVPEPDERGRRSRPVRLRWHHPIKRRASGRARSMRGRQNSTQRLLRCHSKLPGEAPQPGRQLAARREHPGLKPVAQLVEPLDPLRTSVLNGRRDELVPRQGQKHQRRDAALCTHLVEQDVATARAAGDADDGSPPSAPARARPHRQSSGAPRPRPWPGSAVSRVPAHRPCGP